MNIRDFSSLIIDFTAHNRNFFEGAKVVQLDPYNVKDLFDPKNKSVNQKSGLYAYFSDSSGEVLYVGITQDLGARLYQHMKKTAGNWNTPDGGKLFPNSDLLRSKISVAQQESICSGDFSVQFFEVEPFRHAAILEVFAIIKADPPCNILHAAGKQITPGS